jgi:hypothetical protein
MKATEDTTYREIEELSGRVKGGRAVANTENRLITKL